MICRLPFCIKPGMTHEMETATCVNMRSQSQQLDPEYSSESEMYTNPPNSKGRIKVNSAPALGMCKMVGDLGLGLGCLRRFICFDIWMEMVPEVTAPSLGSCTPIFAL